MLQYLAPTNLMILNRGDDPTIFKAVWREVIDLCFQGRPSLICESGMYLRRPHFQFIGVSSSSGTQRKAQLSLIEMPWIQTGSTTGRR